MRTKQQPKIIVVVFMLFASLWSFTSHSESLERGIRCGDDHGSRQGFTSLAFENASVDLEVVNIDCMPLNCQYQCSTWESEDTSSINNSHQASCCDTQQTEKERTAGKPWVVTSSERLSSGSAWMFTLCAASRTPDDCFKSSRRHYPSTPGTFTT